jgi:hypothetical protein
MLFGALKGFENAFYENAAAEGCKSRSCSDNPEKKESHDSIEAQGNQQKAHNVAGRNAEFGDPGASQCVIDRASQHCHVDGREHAARQE